MILPSDDKDLVDFLIYHYEQVKEELADEREKWIRWDRLYNSQSDDEDYPLPFKIFIPWSYSIIETKVPRFVAGLLYRNPAVQVQTAHPWTPVENIRAVSRLLNGKWMIDKQTFAATTMMMKEGLKCGQAYGKIIHCKKKRRIKRPTMVVSGKQLYTDDVAYIENRPRLHHVSNFCVYPDLSGGHDIDDAKFIADVCIKSMDEIRYGDIEYENLDELEEMGDWVDDTNDFERERMESSRKNYLPQPGRDQFGKPRHLLTFTVRQYGKFGEEIHIITIGNKKVLMRHETEYPYWPWVKFTNVPQPHEACGMGEIQPFESIQFGINDFTNINMTNALMALTKMWLIQEDADVDREQMVLQPFNVIETANIEGIKDIQWKGLDASGDKVLQGLVSALQLASGVQDYMQGVTPPRREYASTVMTLQQASEARIDCQIKWAERETISEIARKFIECGQTTLEDPEYVPSDGNQFEVYDLNHIQGLYDFTMAGAASGVNELKRSALMDYAKIAGELMGEFMPMEIRLKLAQTIGRTFDGLEGIDEVLDTLISGQAAQGPPVGPGAANDPGLGGMADPNIEAVQAQGSGY